MLKARLSFLLLAFTGPLCTAQTQTYSPYSGFALGDRLTGVLAGNAAMGSIGVGTASPYSINLKNPASYSSLRFTTIDLSGFVARTKFTTPTAEERGGTGGLSGLAIGLPSNRSFTLMMGLVPFSESGYNLSFTDSLPLDDSTQVAFESLRQGSGGVNSAFIGGAGAFWKRRISVGVNFGYLFGNLSDYWQTTLSPENSDDFRSVIQDNNQIRAFEITTGLQVQDTIKSKPRELPPITQEMRDSLPQRKLQRLVAKRLQQRLFERWVIRGGFTSKFYLGDRLTQERITQQGDIITGAVATLVTDTLRSENSNLNLPVEFGVGLSVEVPLALVIGLDFTFQNWEDFQLQGRDANLRRSANLNAGVEFIPNFYASRQYFSRIAYRIGAGYERTYLQLPDATGALQGLRTLSLTGGLGLPLVQVRRRPEFYTRVNLGFGYYRRGNTSDGLLLENQWRVTFGFSFTQQWFQRSKFN